jgi:hypothetical protein
MADSQKYQEVVEVVFQEEGGKEVNNTLGMFKNLLKAIRRLALGPMRLLNSIMRMNTTALVGMLFFGNQLATMSKKLLTPIMEVYGVFQLWNDLLVLMFLPVMEDLHGSFLTLFEVVAELPDGVKRVIGWFVVLIGVLGTVLMWVGQAAIGVKAIGGLFSGLAAQSAAGGAATTSVFAGIGAAVAVVAGIIALAAAGIWLAWKDNFANIRDWVGAIFESLKTYIGGFIATIQGLFDVFMGIMNGDLTKIGDGLKKMWKGVGDMFIGLAGVLFSIIVSLGIGIFRILFGIGKTIWEAGKMFAEKLWEGIKSMGSWFKDKLVDWVLSAVMSAINSLTNKLKGKKGTGSSEIASGGSFNDFIWRPGQKPISISPEDNIIGFKGAAPNLGGGGQSVDITYNINVSDKRELELMLREHDRNLIGELRRLSSVRGA